MQQKLVALAAFLAGVSAIPVAQYGGNDGYVPPIEMESSPIPSTSSTDTCTDSLSAPTASASDSSVFAYPTPIYMLPSGEIGGSAYGFARPTGHHHHHHWWPHRPHRPHHRPSGWPIPTPTDGGLYPTPIVSSDSQTPSSVGDTGYGGSADVTTTIYATSTIVDQITSTVDGYAPDSSSTDASSTDASSSSSSSDASSADYGATIVKGQDGASSTPADAPSAPTPTPDAPSTPAAPATPADYKQFGGDGSAGAGWPAMSDWVADFDGLWGLQQTNLGAACKNIFAQPDNTAEELTDLKNAIQSVAKDAGIDPRFVLSIVMQESGGCVRAWNTTAPGTPINNPGLMQDHNGAHSCNTGTSASPGSVSSPCPQDQIAGMIHDGTMGTAAGDGLQQLVAQAASKFQAADAQGYYVAARLYNSGSYDGKELGAPGATRCYCSDVANRLRGWNSGNSECKLA